MLERGRAHRTGAQNDSIMLPHTLGRSCERMLATKVRQHTFQSTGAPLRRYSQSLGQRPQVALRRVAPDSIAHLDEPENTPPLQRFFLRLSTVGLGFEVPCSNALQPRWPTGSWSNGPSAASPRSTSLRLRPPSSMGRLCSVQSPGCFAPAPSSQGAFAVLRSAWLRPSSASSSRYFVSSS